MVVFRSVSLVKTFWGTMEKRRITICRQEGLRAGFAMFAFRTYRLYDL